MKTGAKLTKISFLAVGLFTHIARGAAAMLPGSGQIPLPLPPLPPRDSVPDSLLDKSRIRLAESAEPPLAQVWAAGMRQSMAMATPVHRVTVTVVTLSDGAVAAEGQDSAAHIDLSQPVNSLHIVEPPSPVTTPPYQKVSHAETTKALNAFPSLTPIQRLSIRDYVGETKNEVRELNVNGKEVLDLYDPKTHEYRGEAVISANPDGTASVTKVTGGSLDFSHSLQVPLFSGPTEEPTTAMEGENGFNSAKKGWGKLEDNERTTDERTIPAIKVEGSATYGEVTQATVNFERDGAGKEFGYRTQIAGGSAGGTGGVTQSGSGETFTGFKAGVSGQGPKVEGFVNVFTAPQADEKGEFTRTDYGASVDLHASLIDLSGKAGCSSEKGCGVGFSIGGLGIASSASLNYHEKKIEVEPFEGNPKEGIGSSAAEIKADDKVDGEPDPPDVPPVKPSTIPANDQSTAGDADKTDEPDTIEPAEQTAYEAAVKDNSVSAFQDFLKKYPDSPYADTVREREEEVEHPGSTPPDHKQPVPGNENKQGTYPG